MYAFPQIFLPPRAVEAAQVGRWAGGSHWLRQGGWGGSGAGAAPRLGLCAPWALGVKATPRGSASACCAARQCAGLGPADAGDRGQRSRRPSCPLCPAVGPRASLRICYILVWVQEAGRARDTLLTVSQAVPQTLLGGSSISTRSRPPGPCSLRSHAAPSVWPGLGGRVGRACPPEGTSSSSVCWHVRWCWCRAG